MSRGLGLSGGRGAPGPMPTCATRAEGMARRSSWPIHRHRGAGRDRTVGVTMVHGLAQSGPVPFYTQQLAHPRVPSRHAMMVLMIAMQDP